jgi:glycosyltransferase involved in cell wall biosynthesis
VFNRRRKLLHPADRGPLKIMFVITDMRVGGAETLLVNLIRKLDRSRFSPELCCLKELGPLGEVLAKEIPTYEWVIGHKYDVGVLGRLARLMRDRGVDAVVTVGTGGDKMFWGRLAGRKAGASVILSALHSTGLPDHVEFLNRLLVPITDGFIGVAKPHGEYLARSEGCPRRKVFVIPNGVDTDKFSPQEPDESLERELNLAIDQPVATIVAALRPEKNHELFLKMAARVLRDEPAARFLVIGDGPRRSELEQLTAQLGITASVSFLGTRSDVPRLLGLTDVLVLSSHMEANPVSILEALACGKPVVATNVGSIFESVEEGVSGYLVPPGDEAALAARVVELFRQPEKARMMGLAGRDHVQRNWSLDRMVNGYQDLVEKIYLAKWARRSGCRGKPTGSNTQEEERPTVAAF